MTTEEALAWCEAFWDNIIKCGKPEEKYWLAMDAVLSAMDAITKQIPMVPIARNRTTWNGYHRYTDHYCPVCGKQQKNNYSDKRVNEGWYCEKCGQKLRWEE